MITNNRLLSAILAGFATASVLAIIDALARSYTYYAVVTTAG
jgi:hypothetical protein